MDLKFVPHWSIKSPTQLALATYWDKLAIGRRFPAFAEFKPEPGLHDSRQLVIWNVEGEGRLQKFRAVYQGANVADAFNAAWAGKTMEYQVVPMSLRRVTLDGARECATGACPVYAIFSTIDANDTRVDCHRLLLPFGNDGTRVEQIVASLQLTVIETRKKVLNHFAMQTDVLFSGRIKSGFTLPKVEPAVVEKSPAAGAATMPSSQSRSSRSRHAKRTRCRATPVVKRAGQDQLCRGPS